MGVCIPERKRKGQDNWALSPCTQAHQPPPASSTPSNATSHLITDTLIKEGFQLSASRCPYLVVLGQLEWRMEDILVIQFLVYWLGHNGASCCVSYVCVYVCINASFRPLYADTHTQHTSWASSPYDHDPVAGGVRATIAWTGICSRPAVETPANGRHWLKKCYWGGLTGRGTGGLVCTVVGQVLTDTGRETWGRLIQLDHWGWKTWKKCGTEQMFWMTRK